MIDVVAAPVARHFSTERYARSYHLFSRMQADDVQVECIVGHVDVEPTAVPSNVRLHAVEGETKFQYFQRAYRHAHRRLSGADVYHHPNVGFREFDPLAVTGRLDDIPVLLGPAEAGHDIPPQELKMVIDRLVGVDLPEKVVDAAYQVGHPILDQVVNPAREHLFARTLERSDRIIVVHSDARDVYANFVDESRLEVIPYGVDLEEYVFQSRTETHELVVVGDLIYRKGHIYLLDAVSTIREVVSDVQLHIVGDGPIRDELVEYAEDIGVADAVTFHGRVPQSTLLEQLGRARAFVHPSLSEGFSHVRLEAMASGCPVVGTDIDGARDLTRDGVDGHIVPTADADALAEAATDLLTDLEKAREMGRNAREKVERDHNWGDIADQYTEIYRELEN